MSRLAIALLLALVACKREAAPASTTTLVLRIVDGKLPVGARVVLFDKDHQPVRYGSLDLYGSRQATTAHVFDPGTLGTWDGIIAAYGYAEIPVGPDPLRYGSYHVWVWRGVEYERWEGDVDLSAGRGKVEVRVPLARAWTPHGALAADMHVHAHASNDSGLPNLQRTIAQVAAGIQVIGLSDHNTNGSLTDELRELHLDDRAASIASNEVTSDSIHLGVYPVIVDRKAPHGGAPPVDPKAGVQAMFDTANAFPGHPVVQVNHPRFRSTALADATNWNGTSWPPPFPLAFDAVEVLAGYSAFNIPGDRRFDKGVTDYYTFTDHGHLVTAMGNSDTHDLNWVLDGTARTYVFVDDARVKPFDEAGFIAAIRAHRTVATTGPWLDVEAAPEHGDAHTVGPGQALAAKHGQVWLYVRMEQANFVHADKLRITVGTDSGPKLVQTIEVPAGGRAQQWEGAIDVGAHDTWIGVTADGDTPLPLEITGSYQKDKWNHPGVTPFAIASPILVDVDGDGHWKRGDTDLALH